MKVKVICWWGVAAKVLKYGSKFIWPRWNWELWRRALAFSCTTSFCGGGRVSKKLKKGKTRKIVPPKWTWSISHFHAICILCTLLVFKLLIPLLNPLKLECVHLLLPRSNWELTKIFLYKNYLPFSVFRLLVIIQLVNKMKVLILDIIKFS